MGWAPHLHCTKAGAPQVRGVPPARERHGPRGGAAPPRLPPALPVLVPSVRALWPAGGTGAIPRHRSGRGLGVRRSPPPPGLAEEGVPRGFPSAGRAGDRSAPSGTPAQLGRSSCGAGLGLRGKGGVSRGPRRNGMLQVGLNSLAGNLKGVTAVTDFFCSCPSSAGYRQRRCWSIPSLLGSFNL